jgi:exodeoxyribonuclease X
MSALIIDTETTGLDEPQVIQLALMGPMRVYAPPDEAIQCLSFKPSKPISLGAMATHHIIEADLVDAAPWPGSWSPPVGAEYLVGHNVDFDWKAIGSPHVARICTLALARSLWPDVESHSLGALTYYFTDHREARDLLRGAHDAARDVELCCRVLVQAMHKLPTVSNWHDLWIASEKARVPQRFSFGKYGPKDGKPGRLISEVRKLDSGYIRWCLGVDDFAKDPYLCKALRGEAT